jgi:hypothetical protein
VLVDAALLALIRTTPAVRLAAALGVSLRLVFGWRRKFKVRAPRPPQRSKLDSEALACRARELGLRPLRQWRRGGWTPDQLAMLGTADDEVIAQWIGRTVGAVRQKRQALRIKVLRDRRR